MIKRIPCRSSSRGTVRRDAALADPNQSKAKSRMAESIGQLCPLLFCFMGDCAKSSAGAKLECFADFGGDEGRLSPLFGEEMSHSRIPRHNLRHNRCKKPLTSCKQNDIFFSLRHKEKIKEPRNC